MFVLDQIAAVTSNRVGGRGTEPAVCVDAHCSQV